MGQSATQGDSDVMTHQERYMEQFGVRPDGDGALVFEGEIDAHNAGTMERAIAQRLTAKPDQLVLDMREVSFLDSSGVRALLVALATAADLGCRLVVRPSGRVAHVLDMSGLSARFPRA
jgi:anti-anti-sigma factor